MKLIVGLGNPGVEYERTRHNAGFMVVERVRVTNFQFSNSNFQLRKDFMMEVLKKGEVLIAKPTTFMNESGRAVKRLMDFYKIGTDDLWLVHDDLDIRLGEYKIQRGVGPKVHNGVLSVEKELGRVDFWRVRVGIDNRTERNLSGEKYVLDKFAHDELEKLNGVISKILEENAWRI